MRLKLFRAAVIAALLPITAVGQIISYVDTSTRDRLAGAFDMRLDGSAADFSADLKLVGDDGATRFTPRITSSWAPSPRLDVRTLVKSGDLNRESPHASVDTRVTLRPDLRYLARIETSLLRTADRRREHISIRFARVDTGFGLLGGAPLRLGAGVKHERSGERAVTSSSVTSTMGLGDALSLQSELKVDDRAGPGFERSEIDTRLEYRMPFDVVNSLEGEVHRGQNGDRQSLALRLSEFSGETERGGSYAVSGKALVREVSRGDGTESRRLGFETRFSGVFGTPFGGQNTLRLNVERGMGSEDLRQATLSYDHEWRPTDLASIELELKTLRHGDRVEPSMDLRWSARF